MPKLLLFIPGREQSSEHSSEHHEYRCTNRKGHYYGYSVTDKQTNYDEDCLKNEYLVTSIQTAFSVMYLYDLTSQILLSNSFFQALAKIYNNLHFSKPTGKYREEMFQERITDAFFLYSLIEISQRYGLSTTFNPVIEVSITACLPILTVNIGQHNTSAMQLGVAHAL